VVLEAMALGVPVVATDVGGLGEVVTSNVNGVLVPPKKPEELAEAVCGLLKDPARAARLGREARDTVKAKFSVEKMVADYERLYHEVQRSRG
jgi:glycosyltransferase involved in cell wall biosynthesis